MDRVEKGILYLIIWIICITPASFLGGLVIGNLFNFGAATIASIIILIGGIGLSLVWYDWYLKGDPRLK